LCDVTDEAAKLSEAATAACPKHGNGVNRNPSAIKQEKPAGSCCSHPSRS
jgi:hypothetical protein